VLRILVPNLSDWTGTVASSADWPRSMALSELAKED
jgi:hypothetical protein